MAGIGCGWKKVVWLNHTMGWAARSELLAEEIAGWTPPPQNPLWVWKKCLAGKVYEAGSPGVRLGIGHKNFV